MIISEYAKELLKLFGIELKQNKLVQMDTGYEFELTESSKRGYVDYKRDNTIVRFYHFGKKLEPYKVGVIENGFEYTVLGLSYDRIENRIVTVEIKDLGKNESVEVTVSPKIDEKFINTSISHKNGSSISGHVNVDCCLDGYIDCDMRRYDSGGSWGQKYSNGKLINKDNYMKLLEGIFDYSYGYNHKSLRNACIKMVPIIATGYDTFIDYPYYYQDIFRNKFHNDAYQSESYILKRIDEKMQLGNNKLGEMPKNPEEMPEYTRKYVQSAIDLRLSISEMMKEKEKIEAELSAKLKDLEKIIETTERPLRIRFRLD